MQARLQPDNGAAIALIATAAGVGLLYVFRAVLWPLALALVLAILIQAFMRTLTGLWPWLDRRFVLALSGVFSLLLMLGAGLVVFPGVSQLLTELPVLQQRIDALLDAFSVRFRLEEPLRVQMLIGGIDVRMVAAWGLRALSEVGSGLVLTALFLIFLLFTWDIILRRIRIAAGHSVKWPTEVLERSVRSVESYLWIQTLSGLVNAGAAAAIMAAVGLEHWHFWAVGLFLLNYVPFLGMAVGSVAPALFALLQFPTASPALIIFAGIQAVAFVVGNLLVPRMHASKHNLDPCAGLLAVGCWTIVWGPPGAFLAIPLTLVAIYLIAATPRLRWLAILLSNNGNPFEASEEASAEVDVGG